MIYLYAIYTLTLLGLLAAGIREQRRHFANLDSIPVRVLVNGIRGKSSVTRLCAGALRGGDFSVVAKTTGSAARFIWPDGTESPVHRSFNIANVAEQIAVVRQAAGQRPDALVLECMAVEPALQEVNQEKLVRSTIGVITNVREDHLTEMGPTLEDVARSLSRTMPFHGVCVTAEQEWFHVLEDEAGRRDCRLVYANPDSIADEEMQPFSWFTFKENVAIALAVASQVGISRENALRGMYDAAPDPGVLTEERHELAGKCIHFANIFAANDPNSTVMNFERLLELDRIGPPVYVIINCRPDRVERNAQMGRVVSDLLAEKLFVIGHPSRSAIAAVPADWDGEIVDLGGDDRDPEELWQAIVGHVETEASIIAIGNIHGRGEALLEHLAHLETRR